MKMPDPIIEPATSIEASVSAGTFAFSFSSPVRMTGSFPPVRVAVSLNVWADAGAAAFPDRKRVVKELKDLVRILDRGRKK